MKYMVTGDQMTGIADAIRTKTGGTSGIEFPDEFISEIGGLTDTSDATATASDIKPGKTAYVDGEKITGTASVSFSTITSNIQKMGSISQSKHNKDDVLITMTIPDNQLLLAKESLDEYGFEVYNVTQIGNYTSHFKVSEITTRTLGGLSFVETMKIAYNADWTPPQQYYVYVVITDPRIQASF